MRALAIDTETEGLGWNDRVRLVQFGTAEGGWAVGVEDFAGQIRVLETIADHDGLLVMHNCSFDIHQLATIGADVGALWERAIDTYVIAHVLDSSRRNGLDALVKSVLLDDEDAGYKAEFRKWMRKNKYTWADVPTLALEEYGVKDAVKTAQLYALLWPELTERERDIVLREMEVAHEMFGVYERGMRLDVKYATALQQEWEEALTEHRAWFAQFELAPPMGELDPEEANDPKFLTNPNSNAQIARALMLQGWSPAAYTPTGKPKLSKDILEDLVGTYPLVERLLSYKKIQKWKAAYVDNCLEQVDEEGRVHASYNSLGARTGRMSCSNPPLQQLPKGGGGEVRRLFVASEGCAIASVDYSAIEFRLAGHFSGDRRILDVYASGGDWYQQVAEDVGISRAQAKVLVLATLYGAGPKRISKQLNVPFGTARTLVKNFWRAYPDLALWVKHVAAQAEAGQPIYSQWGRHLRPHAAYAAANAIIQGTAAEILKDGLLRLRDADLMRFVVAVVHDETILELPEAEAHAIAHAVAFELTDNRFDVPITAEWRVLGPSWGHGYGWGE